MVKLSECKFGDKLKATRVNLDECKFGDRLKTRDGRMALFLGKGFGFVQEGFVCAIKGEENSFSTMFYRQDGKVFHNAFGNKYDIIGKWEDEIEKSATTYEITPDMPKAIKPIKGVSEAMVEQWLQDIKHLK